MSLLKRSLVVLLMLAIAGIGQIAPAFAVQPCPMNAGAAVPDRAPGGGGQCDTGAGDCTPATACCQIAPNLLDAQQIVFSAAASERTGSAEDPRALVGLRPEPPLHPPTIFA